MAANPRASGAPYHFTPTQDQHKRQCLFLNPVKVVSIRNTLPKGPFFKLQAKDKATAFQMMYKSMCSSLK